MSLSHDGLATSLAAHLRTDRRMTWCNIQLGPSGSIRPDVYAIYKSYTNPCPTAYECKVSAQDFRADVTAGKWQAYLKYACGVYFACEGDLIKKSDVPAHCGLIVLRGDKWRAVRKAVLSPVIIPEDALLKLIIDGVEREGSRYRARDYNESMYLARLNKKFGEVVGHTVRDRLAVEHEIRSAQHSAAEIIKHAEYKAEQIRVEAHDLAAPMRAELCDILGLPPDKEHWHIKKEIARIREERKEHPAHAALKMLTNSLRNTLERYGYNEPEIEELAKEGKG